MLSSSFPVDPTSDAFLKAKVRAGGPTDPTAGFEQAFEKVFEMDMANTYESEFEMHPLY